MINAIDPMFNSIGNQLLSIITSKDIFFTLRISGFYTDIGNLIKDLNFDIVSLWHNNPNNYIPPKSLTFPYLDIRFVNTVPLYYYYHTMLHLEGYALVNDFFDFLIGRGNTLNLVDMSKKYKLQVQCQIANREIRNYFIINFEILNNRITEIQTNQYFYAPDKASDYKATHKKEYKLPAYTEFDPTYPDGAYVNMVSYVKKEG